MSACGELSAWPYFVREAVRRHALARAFWELRHQQVLGDVVAALQTRDIEPVLFKGTALAYGLYANPVWRERSDTDMIVAQKDWGRASDMLVSLGFRRNAGVSGEFVSYQDSYTKESEGGGRHTIDLHRRINNSELLCRLFRTRSCAPKPANCKRCAKGRGPPARACSTAGVPAPCDPQTQSLHHRPRPILWWRSPDLAL